MVNMLDCHIIVSEFEVQLHFYIPFWTNVLRKGINTIIPWAMY